MVVQDGGAAAMPRGSPPNICTSAGYGPGRPRLWLWCALPEPAVFHGESDTGRVPLRKASSTDTHKNNHKPTTSCRQQC